MSSEIAEPKYEPIAQYVSQEDIEIAEILQSISDTIDKIDATIPMQSPTVTADMANMNTDATIPMQSPTVTDDITIDKIDATIPMQSPTVTDDMANMNTDTDIPMQSPTVTADIVSRDSAYSPLEPINIDRVSLVALVTKIVLDNELQKKYELPIDAKYIQCIQQIIASDPSYLGRFETSVLLIVKDGRISIADIPEIIKMVTELYSILFSIHPTDMINIYAGLLKPVFFIAIKEKVVIVDNETEVIAAFDSFIDAIVDLLKMQLQFTTTCSTLTCDFTHMWWFK